MKTLTATLILLLLQPVAGHAQEWAERNVREHDAWIAAEIDNTQRDKQARQQWTDRQSAEYARWVAAGHSAKCFFVVCGVKP